MTQEKLRTANFLDDNIILMRKQKEVLEKYKKDVRIRIFCGQEKGDFIQINDDFFNEQLCERLCELLTNKIRVYTEQFEEL
jgi:hypothetical protein